MSISHELCKVVSTEDAFISHDAHCFMFFLPKSEVGSIWSHFSQWLFCTITETHLIRFFISINIKHNVILVHLTVFTFNTNTENTHKHPYTLGLLKWRWVIDLFRKYLYFWLNINSRLLHGLNYYFTAQINFHGLIAYCCRI